jgi:hypothetical protein
VAEAKWLRPRPEMARASQMATKGTITRFSAGIDSFGRLEKRPKAIQPPQEESK